MYPFWQEEDGFQEKFDKAKKCDKVRKSEQN